MQGEQNTSAEHGLLGRIDDIHQKLEGDPEFSRRAVLIGMGAVSVLTALQGGGALLKLRSREQLAITSGDICPDHDIQCYLNEADLDVPAVHQSSTIEATNISMPITEEQTVTAPAPPPPDAPVPPPETPTTVAPPPPLPRPEVVHTAAAELSPAPRREMSYGEFSSNAELLFSRLPTIETLDSIFPGTSFFQDIPGQKQYIEDMRSVVMPTPDKFHAFGFDTRLSGMFNQHEPLSPKMVVWHWTGWDYKAPEELQSMRPNSVQMYVHSDAAAYQVVPNLDVIAGHARVLNPFAWGIEIHSGHYDGTRSPLFNYTAPQIENSIYAAVNRLRSANLPVDATTLVGHATADLIFMNPYYDPYNGTFHEVPGYKPPHLHKYDPPQEFMQMVVHKAAELNAALGPR